MKKAIGMQLIYIKQDVCYINSMVKLVNYLSEKETLKIINEV